MFNKNKRNSDDSSKSSGKKLESEYKAEPIKANLKYKISKHKKPKKSRKVSKRGNYTSMRSMRNSVSNSQRSIIPGRSKKVRQQKPFVSGFETINSESLLASTKNIREGDNMNEQRGSRRVVTKGQDMTSSLRHLNLKSDREDLPQG